MRSAAPTLFLLGTLVATGDAVGAAVRQVPGNAQLVRALLADGGGRSLTWFLPPSDVFVSEDRFAEQKRGADVSAIYKSAVVALMTGRHARAAEHFAQLRPARPEVAGFLGGVAHLRSGDDLAALRAWSDSDTLSLARTRAHAAIAQGRADDAVRPMQILAASGFQPIQTWVDLSELHMNRGDWTAAFEAIREAERLSPADLNVQYRLAYITYHGLRDARAATARLESLVAAPRADERVLNNAYLLLGRMAVERGDFSTGLAWYERSLRLPNVAPRFALHEIAAAQRRQGNLAGAKDTLRTALAQAPDDADTLARLADVHRAAGEPAEAIALHRRAVRLAPDVQDYRVRLAESLMEAGHRDEAVEAWERVLSADPANAAARRALAGRATRGP